jgi:hypothetical protein
MKKYKYDSHLGSIEIDVKTKMINGIEVLDYEQTKKAHRMIAYKFLVEAQSRETLLTPSEVEGIIYFVGVNINKLSKILGVDRSTLTNVIKGKNPSRLLCHSLLKLVEQELMIENYFIHKYNRDVPCKVDQNYIDLLISQRAA